MFNNFSYRPFSISGGPNTFTFTTAGNTVRMQPAIIAWRTLASASVTRIEPDPGNDGIWFMGYKVTDLGGGMWHYEYALFNMNLDRAIQSFSVPLGPGVNVTNIEFHAPPQHPGWAHDGTQGDAGYSSTPWDVTTPTRLPPRPLSHGPLRLLRRIRTPTRFAGARCITSGSTLTRRPTLPTQQ